jgi:hypothetical protein
MWRSGRIKSGVLWLSLPLIYSITISSSQGSEATDDGHATDDHSTTDDAHHGDDHGHHSDEFGQVLIFFLTVGLCIGAITDFTLSRFGIKVAYTVVMFFEGILFGFLLNNSALGKTIHRITQSSNNIARFFY